MNLFLKIKKMNSGKNKNVSIFIRIENVNFNLMNVC